MSNRKTSRRITLLELVIVLALILLTSGMVIGAGKSLLDRRQLNNEKTVLMQALRSAYELSAATEQDWIVSLQPEGTGIRLSWGPEWPPKTTVRSLPHLQVHEGFVVRYAATGAIVPSAPAVVLLGGEEKPLDFKGQLR